MRSSMRCRPRIGRETAVGVIVICELSLEISTITEAPTVIPRESTIDFGSRTPWLFHQRCNVVFMRGSIARGYTRSNGKFFGPNDPKLSDCGGRCSLCGKAARAGLWAGAPAVTPRAESSMNQPTRENERRFLKNCLKGGGGGAWSWEVEGWRKGRNQVLAGRGSGCLESDGGIWGDEIAGEIRRLTRVKWRAGWWGRVAWRSKSLGASRFGEAREKLHRGLVQPRLALRSGQGKYSSKASNSSHG